MENWLESAENEKLLELIKKKELEKKRELISMMEEKVHSNLKIFYELCQRVNRVKPNSLIISRLKIHGTKRFEIEKYVYEGSGIVASSIEGSRSLVFDCSNVEKLMMNVVIYREIYKEGKYYPAKFSRNGEWLEELSIPSKHSTETEEVLHKRFLPEDILNWTEEEMLVTIQYLLLEVKHVNLPGKELAIEWQIDLMKKENSKLTKAMHELSVVKEFHIGRSKKEKEEQIKNLEASISEILEKINSKEWKLMSGIE